MVTVKLSASVRLPSETVRVRVTGSCALLSASQVFWSAAGVTVTVRLLPLPPRTMPLSGMTVPSPVSAVTCRDPSSLSTSVTVKSKTLVLLSSLMVWLLTSEMTGASLTGLTVTVTVAVCVALFSSTTV